MNSMCGLPQSASSTTSLVLPWSCANFASVRDRTNDVVRRSADLSRGTFPLWPINRFFAGFAGTGGPVEQMLREAGIVPGGNADVDDEIATPHLLRLLRRTMRLTRDELWGLRPTPTRLGTFAQACRQAVGTANVEQALRAGFRHYHGLVDDFTLRLTHEGDQARIVIVDSLPQRPGREILHMIVLQALRETIEWLSGRAGLIERVDFQYAPLPHVATLEAIFRAGFVHHAPRTGLVISPAVLAWPVVAETGQVRGFVDSLLSKLAMVVQDRRSVADRAASYIRAQGDWDIGREAVAEALNMSAATFRRRLHEDIGVGFQELKDRLRCAAAVELIAADGVNLESVARTLGFSELSSFHRAFKRWTGQGPGSFRRGAAGLHRAPAALTSI